MNEYVVDTHALYWYLTAAPQLGANALIAFREGEQGKARLYIPGIVLAELYYLNVKAGKPLSLCLAYRSHGKGFPNSTDIQ